LKNYKITIQYDGTNYYGWQIQKSGSTVQGVLKENLEKLTRSEINLIGAGRTDAGVHAYGQVANFQIDRELDIYKFKHALNSILPKSISISKMEEVPVEFHSRFDAIRRSYFYIFAPEKNAFMHKYSYYYPRIKKMDIDKLNEISKELWGKKDFTSFSRKLEGNKNSVCTIYNTHWKIINGMYVFLIEADRYLRGMVRAITGTLINVYACQNPSEKLTEIIQLKDRQKAGQSVPPQGLFLYKVRY